MAKIIILGAKGSLGQSFSKIYANENLLAWDRSDLDITNFDEVKKKLTQELPNLVINCVAYNAVDKAEEEPDIANNINGYAVGNLAKVCKAVGAKLVHFSSNYVFDGTNQNGYNESEIPSPQSAYGRSKLLGEVQIQQHSDNYYIIRSTWLYGTPGLSESSKKNYVETILELVPQKEYIECVDDQYGQPTYTHDLATATKTLIEQDLPAGIYHLTNSGSATWFTWAEEIFRLKQITIQLHHNSMANFNRAAHRPQYGILNNSKFPVLRPWQKALADYLTSN